MAHMTRTQHAPVTTPLPTGLIKQHPVVTFYALAFAISWLGILVVVGGPGRIPATPEEGERLFLPVMMAWLAGPSVASLLMTLLVNGRRGLLDLVTRLVRWRVGPWWFVVALLTAPLIDAATSFALSPVSAEFLPNIVKTSDKAGVLVMALAYGVIGGGFLEELGWTGFAVPRLRARRGVLATGLVAGLLWGAYHFSVIYWSTATVGALGLMILVVQLFAWLPAYRILMVWVYDRTQSLLVAMLMHASLTASMLVLQPMTISGMQLLTYLVVFAVVLWALVAVIMRHGPSELARSKVTTKAA